MTWMWREEFVEKVARAALLCAQVGVLGTLVVGILNLTSEVVELVARKRKSRT